MKRIGLYALLLLVCVGASGSSEQGPQSTLSDFLRQHSERLRSRDAAIRKRAVEESVKFGDEIRGVVYALDSLLLDRDPNVRLSAARALIDIGPSASGATSALRVALKDESLDVRAAAASALAVTAPHSRTAIPALLAALRADDNDKVVKLRVIGALGRFGADARAAVPYIIPALEDHEEAVKHNTLARAAARALDGIGPAAAEAVPALIKSVKSADSLVQAHAIEALGGIGPAHPDVLPALFRLLKATDPKWFPDAAARSLGRIGPPAKAAVPELLDLLKARGRKARSDCQEFLTALASIAPESDAVLSAVVDILNDKKANPDLRTGTIHTLEKIGPAAKAAVPALIAALKETLSGFSAGNREPIHAALVAVGADAAPALAEFLRGKEDESLRRIAIRILADMGPTAKAAIPVLRELARDAERFTRGEAAAALKRIEPGK